jgi:hypothetical protein
MAKKTTIYAATKSAKDRLAKGEYKKRCVKGCACGTSPSKNSGNGSTRPDVAEKK